MIAKTQLIALGTLLVNTCAQGSTVVYYNLTNPLNDYVGGFPYVEAADEISLAEGPRYFERARIAYYGANFDGDETLTLSDQVHAVRLAARNHGQFVSGVAKLKNDWRKSGLLTAEQAQAVQTCAATTKAP